jgi:hypothetical protein
LSVNDQHGKAVDDRPDVWRHEHRIVAADEPGVLLIRQGIDQHLKSGLGLAKERSS